MTIKPLRVLQVILLSPILLFFGLILAPIFLLYFVALGVQQFLLLNRLRASWPPGKFVLVAYTNSPVWSEYIETRLLPELEPFSVVVNRSLNDWKRNYPLEAKALEIWGGDKAYNPLVVVFRGRLRARTFRFYEEFRDYKHGKASRLENQVKELIVYVNEIRANAAGIRESER